MKISKLHKNLVKKLFSILEQREISAYQIWQKTKISQGTLSMVKSGKRQLSMGSFIKICEAFKFDIDIVPQKEIAKKNKIMLLILRSIKYHSPYTNRGLCSSFSYLLAA